MLRKKETFTVITPIPGFIPRQLALDILHSHSEVITLNPLVLRHKPIPAPQTAAADEYYSTWYEITERVQVVPGVGRAGSKETTFQGCFHDMPWGLQTHIYAILGIDIRIRYRVGGNQPGFEPPEQRELGQAAQAIPAEGLYLREDIEIKCNISLVSFVKSQLKAASKEMVDRIIRKAELLDAGTLQAMMTADGKLKTVNPNDRSQGAGADAGGTGPLLSPRLPYQRSPSAPPYAHVQSAASPDGNYPQSPGQYYQYHGQPSPGQLSPGQLSHGPPSPGPPSPGYPSSQYGQQQQQHMQRHPGQASPQPMEFPAEMGDSRQQWSRSPIPQHQQQQQQGGYYQAGYQQDQQWANTQKTEYAHAQQQQQQQQPATTFAAELPAEEVKR
ncbi:uncharacterized protein F5Z01DRAFT_233262 [Emericellopsis atlantica]|uniref:DUF7053 domain-containing protein n=1 Tax=Emericellopsis atlantica TaxID=2614577 RepID=A0A9P7ZIY5_9HYPO|nr:uncharacterized protein F5Z01DRAFT_233262 [Emericellopsis atlantica]KAG9252561.1 hypothetical protein F5Z01DRAFT_233262 [Emericellopsis atlantica]